MLANATLLDPRFKTVVFGSAVNADAAVKDCISECSALIMRETSKQLPPPESPQPSTSAGGLGDGEENLWELLDNKISETQKVHSVTADANAVILKHTIWAKHQMFFPHLFHLAKNTCQYQLHLCHVNTFFSKAEVLCKKRNRLNTKTLEQLLFLNTNS